MLSDCRGVQFAFYFRLRALRYSFVLVGYASLKNNSPSLFIYQTDLLNLNADFLCAVFKDCAAVIFKAFLLILSNFIKYVRFTCLLPKRGSFEGNKLIL